MIKSKAVKVDQNVSGFTWEVTDFKELAKLIAIVAVGQAAHAARILEKLEPNQPAFSDGLMNADACEQLTIQAGLKPKSEMAARAHRDGFLFECISWVITRQGANERTFHKDPHTSPTSQGLDGLIVELDAKISTIKAVTICEDKCTINPSNLFKSQVMKTFKQHHGRKKRSRELLTTAVDLIKTGFPDQTAATRAAAKVSDLGCRIYRAALTVDSSTSTAEKRAKLFEGYSSLAGITKAQRVGATFVVNGDLRNWFQQLADAVITEIKSGKVKNV
ncbi:hypothetical protein BO996_11950 [Delftia sp. HK171]|uniref:hypothetical protein n=1 Tax=Delftia sp. HK171 TaxID=1920191 RepID=UPI000903E292|nr:hypothetical protein [Delftia sp. HK171]APE48509.1 hypothetical protein BO996_11950 [Delftia sp. HK171]